MATARTGGSFQFDPNQFFKRGGPQFTTQPVTGGDFQLGGPGGQPPIQGLPPELQRQLQQNLGGFQQSQPFTGGGAINDIGFAGPGGGGVNDFGFGNIINDIPPGATLRDFQQGGQFFGGTRSQPFTPRFADPVPPPNLQPEAPPTNGDAGVPNPGEIEASPNPKLDDIIDIINKGIPTSGLFPSDFDFGDFFSGPNLPGAPDFTGANLGQSRDILGQVAQGGLQGPSQNLDRAANRLRDRLSQEARSSREQVSGGRAGRGFQGATQQALEGVEGQRLGAFEEGLVGLERDFEQARLQGLGLAQQAGSGLGRLGLDEADQANRFAQDIFGTMTDAELEKFGLTSENVQSLIDALTQTKLGGLGFAGDIIGGAFTPAA